MPAPEKSAALLTLAVAVAACGKPDILHVEDQPRPVRSMTEVQLLLEAPDRPHRTIGLIRSSKADLFVDMDDLKKQVREAAARLGADAVILSMAPGESSSTTTTTGPDGMPAIAIGGGDNLRLYGRAIVFEEGGR